MTDGTRDTLRDMVEAIVEAVDPEQIILFGSQARGDARTGSDIDLLVVETDPFSAVRSRRKELARVCRALAPYTVPIDVLLYSRAELAQWKHSRTHVIGRALRDGKVVYARS
jgi:predicted nucleotidyltransferase